ncbi:olfactory receptor 2A12-like [Boleophthalmus pectinirostris]|uniref:olfactory receptor 2A12-like n=1 Tax=Boleophthalmus pectinirostris TaxID=150288 RepID=UPI00242AC803|nr:olfactory receptor 2A12-like [Boleophthalmus pectinirostris]
MASGYMRRRKQSFTNTVYSASGELLTVTGEWKEHFEDLLNPTIMSSEEEEDLEADSTITLSESLRWLSSSSVMQNLSSVGPWLQVEGFLLSGGWSLVALVCFLLLFLVGLMANGSIAMAIARDRALHTPMYLLFVQLTLSDVMLNLAVMPQVLVDLLRPPNHRVVHLSMCILQAFLLHFGSILSYTILMTMAFDRYMAICNPLRYTTIMSGRMLVLLTVLAWGGALLLVSILIGPTLLLSRCRSIINGLYCTNASLFKLSCENTFLQNVLGLVITAVLLGGSICIMLFTYLRITVVCVGNQSSKLNKKALQTCSTHLLVFLLLLISSLSVVGLQRVQGLVEERKVIAMLKDLLLAAFNPIIYGLQSKEVRRYLLSCSGSRTHTQ